jgi:hypothetical protein
MEQEEAYLRSLGVEVFVAEQSTDVRSFELIDDADANGPPTEKQIEILQRLGVLDETNENTTASDVNLILERAFQNPPTGNQLTRAKELGITICEDAEFTAGNLDLVLNLADQPPNAEMIKALSRFGIRGVGTALEGRMALDLALALGTGFWRWRLSPEEIERRVVEPVQIPFMPNIWRWNLQPKETTGAFVAAIRDPAFSSPRIHNCTMGLQYFHWSEVKMQEWAARGKSATK